jgi:hypothetical protein
MAKAQRRESGVISVSISVSSWHGGEMAGGEGSAAKTIGISVAKSVLVAAASK